MSVDLCNEQQIHWRIADDTRTITLSMNEATPTRTASSGTREVQDGTKSFCIAMACLGGCSSAMRALCFSVCLCRVEGICCDVTTLEVTMRNATRWMPYKYKFVPPAPAQRTRVIQPIKSQLVPQVLKNIGAFRSVGKGKSQV